jgi:hypothetical protein
MSKENVDLVRGLIPPPEVDLVSLQFCGNRDETLEAAGLR